MENKKYLSEERYQQNNAKVKKVGKILLIVGIITLVLGVIFTIMGFIGTGNSAVNSLDSFSNNNVINGFNSFDNNEIISGTQEVIDGTKNTAKSIFGNIGVFAIGGFMDSIGLFLIIAGGILLIIAHRREITAYAAQQMIPVGKEIVEEVTPTIGNAAGTIAQSISKGIKEGLKDSNSDIN